MYFIKSYKIQPKKYIRHFFEEEFQFFFEVLIVIKK